MNAATGGDEDGEVTVARFFRLAAEPLTPEAIDELASWIGERLGQNV